jgi:protein TonB
MAPQEELRFFIVHEAPIPQEAPPAPPPPAVRPPEPPSTSIEPEPAPRKPAAVKKKSDRASSAPERTALKRVPVPTETAAEAQISSSPEAAGNSVDQSAALPSPEAGVAAEAALASIPGEPGSSSGPVAFGSLEGPGFLRRSLPRYPRRARDMGREGTVVLRVAIDQKGNLVNVEVVQPAGFGFDEEALRAVRESTFKPAVRNGRPVACLADLPVRFVLRRAEDD